ncbi:hypothetical protein LEP1GSC016_3772 [Leptospira borgpetersenii serovar Hardjo-bovis str. Sponselee]|uniref:Uncharacterized protein n=6 Tax=Leptospira borgpetersenii TaxID=174 RepID=M3GAR8_LEPBO|nr:hypothetical protein LBBP_03802 [Leptospira borgpetersenii serovar Ballum]EKP12715.1 hypothetical protein LEP1GSC128_3858 [Leptospira borgpetersenii str. 200801926]EKQ93826.1 hypothetical protein LEP1GSC101_1802 [Leptospira borgpetersenii str. UI 09149]EKQ99990.1 hypothetical protein LEP1GSC121_3537 [Leptospira borgpetersenii serovar Castellonis str. 200801910]EMF97996.1 hypothetical protein LEP1GSC123_1828 [Leptospira borgpetersenii str. 200701203]EMJ81933.1 hypothetical protein LEP1GSC016
MNHKKLLLLTENKMKSFQNFSSFHFQITQKLFESNSDLFFNS